VRLVSGATKGPAHEIHAGSGYWSQDSAVAVLARKGDRVWIRWPGGRETMSPIPAHATSFTIDSTGKSAEP
jgi:hypothetical protein